MTEIITAIFGYASTYDKILATVGSFLIVIGLLGGIDGKLKIPLSVIRQFMIVLVGLVMVLLPILPILFRQVSLQELNALKTKIDESREELRRYDDKNGGDHPLYLSNDLIEAQQRVDALIAKKRGE